MVERRKEEVKEREMITGYYEVGGNNEGETEVELTMEGSTFVGRKRKEGDIGSSGGQEKKLSVT